MLEYSVVLNVEKDIKKVLPPGIEIIREYRTIRSRRVDFVLVRGFEILACIEVKTDLSDEKMLDNAQKQVKVYQRDTHSYWAIVTDGNRYYIQSITNDKFEEKENAEAVIKVILGVGNEKEVNALRSGDDSRIESLKCQLLEICEDYNQIPTIQKIRNVLAEISNANCEVLPSSFTFKRSFENRFFQALLGVYTGDEVVRYIPFSSAYRSLNEQTIGMVSLIGMNDVSECYYVDQYIAKKKGEDSSKSILPAERKLLNNTYILSCNDLSMEDDLTMWRLYGANCKGVCIKLIVEKDVVEKNNTFMLAPVSYGKDGDTHPELDFVDDIMSQIIEEKNLLFKTWCYWKHFFKDYRYSVEKEVRLVYTGSGCGKRSWIMVKDNEIPCPISIFPIRCLPNHSNDFPMTIKEIIIGSKCADKETKQSQFYELIKERNAGYDKDFAEVKLSEIDNYR
jgi:hypothetical protein